MYKFKYHKPTSLEESINLFKEKEFPKYLSGGMTLIPSMKQLLSSPTDLIDIQDIKESINFDSSRAFAPVSNIYF